MIPKDFKTGAEVCKLNLSTDEYILVRMATRPKAPVSYYIESLAGYFNLNPIEPIDFDTLKDHYFENRSEFVGLYYFCADIDDSALPLYMLNERGEKAARIAAKKIGLTL
jgi:hypothetical protein